MKQDKRISAGDLAVCTFEGMLDGTKQRFLAIMKIDPTTALRPTREEVGGQLLITFEVEQQMLPTQGEKLQKAAFIWSLEPRAEYDMLLIDRQVKPPEGPRIAQFFSRRFLGAVEAMSSEEATASLVQKLGKLQGILKGQLEPAAAQRFDQAVAALTTSARVDLDVWPGTLALPDAARREVERALASPRFPERQFEISPDVVAQQRVKKRVFLGDHDVRLEIPGDFPEDNLRVARKKDPQKFGGKSYHVVTIETETWRERS